MENGAAMNNSIGKPPASPAALKTGGHFSDTTLITETQIKAIKTAVEKGTLSPGASGQLDKFRSFLGVDSDSQKAQQHFYTIFGKLKALESLEVITFDHNEVEAQKQAIGAAITWLTEHIPAQHQQAFAEIIAQSSDHQITVNLDNKTPEIHFDITAEKLVLIELSFVDSGNPKLKETWFNIRRCFEPKDCIEAFGIIKQLSRIQGRHSVSEFAAWKIEGIHALLKLAKPEEATNFGVEVAADREQLAAGKVAVGIRLFGKSEEKVRCDATQIAGKLMGFNTADPIKIAEEMNAQEKTLVAKLLVTMTTLEKENPLKDILALKADIATAHGNDLYDIYRPGETMSSKPVALKTEQFTIDKNTKFVDPIKKNLKGIRPDDNKIYSLFTNIGYRKDDTGAVTEFLHVHPLLQSIYMGPQTVCGAIIERTLRGFEFSDSAIAALSNKFVSSDEDYQNFMSAPPTLQTTLMELYAAHDTLNLSCDGFSRNAPVLLGR